MFVVIKRMGRNETRLQQFTNQPLAIDFIQENLRNDQAYKISASYALVDDLMETVIQEYTFADLIATQDDNSASSSGKSNSPSPLRTTPAPTGTPHSWVSKDDEDDQ